MSFEIPFRTFRNGFPLSAVVFLALLMAGQLLAGITCDHCGRAITGQYIEADSGIYHVHCYEDFVALRCGICGDVINGQYYIDSRDNIFHHWHQEEYYECEYCGCLICEALTEGGVEYEDGRHVCGLCLKTAVNDVDEAQRLMEKAIDLLDGARIDVDEDDIPLELVDAHGMSKVSKGSSDDALGYTTFRKQSIFGGLVSSSEIKIYLLKGMPRGKFLFSAAHELMHVWLFKNGPKNMDEQLCEGSCDYAGALAILASDEDEAARVYRQAMENTDETYGEGLRQVDAYASRVGISTWLRYLKGHCEPPW